MILLIWELRRPFLAFAYQISREPQVLADRHLRAASADVHYWFLPPRYSFTAEAMTLDARLLYGLVSFLDISIPFIECGLCGQKASR